MASWLCTVGHVAATRDLAKRGVTKRQLAAAVDEGRLVRVRLGTYACSHHDDLNMLAAGAGVRVDCVTLLGSLENQWSGITPPGLHVRARAGTHIGELPAHTVVHWSEGWTGPVTVIEALLRATGCLGPIDWLACVESALHLGHLTDTGLAALVARTPRRLRRTLAKLDRGAQSGLETHGREKIHDAGHTTQSQFAVPGAGTVDLLVDGCVAVETDGEKWHEGRFHADRTKDIRVRAWNYPVLRIGRPHLFELWPETVAALEDMIRDARAARPGTHRS